MKGKKLAGFDFHRQKPLDEYIVDFYCSELNFAIEIDGRSHDFKMEEDQERQKRLESFGVKFLRFKDEDIKKNIEGCIKLIEKWIVENEYENFEK